MTSMSARSGGQQGPSADEGKGGSGKRGEGRHAYMKEHALMEERDKNKTNPKREKQRNGRKREKKNKGGEKEGEKEK